MLQAKCRLFVGCKDKGGYGIVHRDNKTQNAHVYVFKKLKGPIPKGHVVMHTCDTPACIEPEHLVLGTQQDNMTDSALKGRMAKKLTREQVDEIRIALQSPYRGQGRALAKKYNVGAQAISNIKRGNTWHHVPSI